MNSQAVSAPSEEAGAKAEPNWGAVWAMSLCAMTLVASEFLPVSLLTPIASDLKITEGYAGQTISVSGLFALITSLVLTSLIGRIDRRSILLFFTALMGVSGTMVALAPTPAMMMTGRALIGICIGGFWSMSAATALRLVPGPEVPKALAILNGGNALATTVAAPLGSFLGGLIGWRGAFFCIVPLSIVAFAWQWFSLPSLPVKPVQEKVSVGSLLRLLGRRSVGFGMLSVSLFFMGQFTLFTYLRPFLESITGVDVRTLSLFLLAMGLFGLIGTLIVDRLLKRHLHSILITTPLCMTLLAVALVVFGKSATITCPLLCAWGLFGTSVPVAWWTWLSKTLPDEAEAGGGLMVAVIQLAITTGSALGGVVFDAYGGGVTFLASASILLVATLIALLTWRLEARRTQNSPANRAETL